MLTIAYFTSRKEPKIEWFFKTLHRETGGDYTNIKVIVVDFWLQPSADNNWTDDDVRARFQSHTAQAQCPESVLMAPKPTVWQGPHRLTKTDYFAAANARNTAICCAPDGWIAFVDDLSVLMPGWLSAVREAISGNYIACGSYRKVSDLEMSADGRVMYGDYLRGHDHRAIRVQQDVTPCTGEWLYGCSLVAPVEAFLKMGGYPEIADGMGYEDCVTGQLLEKHGYRFNFDRRMLTFESFELHDQKFNMKRVDKGASPNDKSHALLKIARQSLTFPNYFGDGGIRAARQKILAGEPFPIVKVPEHDWFDGQPLSEM